MKKQLLIIIALLCYCSDIKAHPLDSLIGRWICSGFEKLDYPLAPRTDKEFPDYQNDNFAKEFMEYSYFDIKSEEDSTFSISVVDRFVTPFLQTKEMVIDSATNVVYDQKLANCILEYYKVNNGRFLKTTKKYSYYVDFPSLSYYEPLPFSELMYYDADGTIVIPYKGFLFFYNKGEYKKSGYNIEGVPGDGFNYFVVNQTFKDKSISDVYEMFCIDFPFGSNGFPKELPLENYKNYERPDIDITMEWITEHLLHIKTNNPMGAFKIEFEQVGTDVRLLYRFSYWGEDFGDDFDG